MISIRTEHIYLYFDAVFELIARFPARLTKISLSQM